MAPPHFWSVNTKICGQAGYIKDNKDVCLVKDQTKYICKKVETENIVNIDTTKQEIEEDNLKQMDDTNGEINPYHEINNK